MSIDYCSLTVSNGRDGTGAAYFDMSVEEREIVC